MLWLRHRGNGKRQQRVIRDTPARKRQDPVVALPILMTTSVRRYMKKESWRLKARGWPRTVLAHAVKETGCVTAG